MAVVAQRQAGAAGAHGRLMPLRLAMKYQRRREGSISILKKRNKKLLLIAAGMAFDWGLMAAHVFDVFVSKKKFVLRFIFIVSDPGSRRRCTRQEGDHAVIKMITDCVAVAVYNNSVRLGAGAARNGDRSDTSNGPRREGGELADGVLSFNGNGTAACGRCRRLRRGSFAGGRCASRRRRSFRPVPSCAAPCRRGGRPGGGGRGRRWVLR